MAAPWLLLLTLAGAAAEFCSKPGEVKYVEPSSEHLCVRTGDMHGVELLPECMKSLEHISDDKTPAPPVHSSGADYCLPGKSIRITKQVFTCHCTKAFEWDCHKGRTDDTKPVPLDSIGRSLEPKQRQCEKDVIVPRMFTDFCDLYGNFITFDDCIIPRNQTAHSHTLAEVQGPVTCLPGSYVIYLRCMKCPCASGIAQACTDFVDCPWIMNP